MSRFRLRLLGSPRLERDGAPVDFDTRKNLALIAYLAMAGEPLRRDAVCTLLWPELEPTRARAGLRRNLSNIRKALGGEWLVADRNVVGLEPEAEAWVDVARFRSLVEAVQAHGHPPGESCPKCLEALAEAAELYRGDFLSGFTLRDSLAFDEWQFFQAEGLRQVLASALERLVRGHSDLGAYEVAIPYARRWVALDPLHEPAQRQLMQLYARSGQQAAALRQYQACARVLEAELGLPPSEGTTTLLERIQAQPPGVEQPRPAPAGPPHNLPEQTTPLVGREEELAAVRARLQDPECRLLTLLGPGGMGKTRLALQVAADLVEEAAGNGFEDGICFVPLAPVQSADAVAPAVAQAVGFSFHEGRPPWQQLLDHLRPKRLLLILDNVEHLVDVPDPARRGGAGLANDLLEVAPGLKILATSRARLRVRGEHLYHLTGLQVPEEESRPDIQAHSAVRLFVEAARRARADFPLGPDALAHVARVCRLVEGMPLGILLAAGWVGVLSPREIAAEIEGSLDFLETDLQDVPERQRSIRAAFNHSWHLLSKREREIFQALSVLRGAFTQEAAREIAGASLRDLQALTSKSLLQRASSGRVEVHELLRQYAVEKLAAAPEAWEAVRGRHSAYYARVLQRLEEDLKGARQQAAMAELDAEIENARVAWEWATEHEQVQQLDQAMDALALFFRWRSRHQEGKILFRRTAERLSGSVARSTAPSGDAVRVLARLLTWQSRLWGDEYDWPLLEQSLRLLEQADQLGQDTRRERAFALQQMGWCLGGLAGEEPERAKELCQASLGLYEQLDDQFGMAAVLDTLGFVAQNTGAYGAAQQWYQQGLALRQAMGDQKGMARSLISLSTLAQNQGQPETSARLAERGIAICREIGDLGGLATGLLNLGATLLLMGDYGHARSLLEQSPALERDLGFATVSTRTYLALVHSHLGLHPEASALARAALAQAREIGHRPHIATACWCLGCVALAQGAQTESWALLQESAALFRGLNQPDNLWWALACLPYAARSLEGPREARRMMGEALRPGVGNPAAPQVILLLGALAPLLADEGEVERAVELYALVLGSPVAANSRWFEDVAGRQIAAAAEALPPTVAAAARERGRGRDLQDTVTELLAELDSS
jgi:predicted ATPase/DNA-binding SARP family transcriptional activator